MKVDQAARADNRRTVEIHPLAAPATVRAEFPADDAVAERVLRSRSGIVDVLQGHDDRLLVVVGPCSIHDPGAAREYAGRLASRAESLSDRLLVVMRTYFEKPRTSTGWKGLVNDPGLDGTFDVNEGLRIARSLLLDVLDMGLPVGCEFLDPITPQYLADLVSWGSIGARTASSQVHRQLCSGLSMPVGIKNTPDGDVGVAVDAVRAAASGHVFMGIGDDGRAALFGTEGNPDTHVVLRGSTAGPNHDPLTVAATVSRLERSSLRPQVVVDASHGNSGKDHRRQPHVVREVAARVSGAERGLAGVMLESFLVEGRQSPGANLIRGQSITDACIDWKTTSDLLGDLAAAVDTRRGSKPDP